MFRTSLFTLYGLAVGTAYAALFRRVLHDYTVAWVVVGFVLIVCLGFIGRRYGQCSDLSWFKCLVLIPLSLPIGLATILGLAMAIACLTPVLVAKGRYREHSYRRKLKRQGRIPRHSDLRAKLDAGEGTFIEEKGELGIINLWWTEDDLFSLGRPVSSDAEFKKTVLAESHPFNSRCLKEYLDQESGKALLISPPRSPAKWKKLYPRMKTAVIVRPTIPLDLLLVTFDRQLEQVVQPALLPRGFVFGPERTFRRNVAHEGTRSTQIIEFQIGSEFMLGQFTVNLAVYNPDYLPNAWHRPEGEPRAVDSFLLMTQRLGLFHEPARTLWERWLKRKPEPVDFWWELSESDVSAAAALREVCDLVVEQGIQWLDTHTTLAAHHWAMRQLERQKEWKASLGQPGVPTHFHPEPFLPA